MPDTKIAKARALATTVAAAVAAAAIATAAVAAAAMGVVPFEKGFSDPMPDMQQRDMPRLLAQFL